VSLRVLLAGGGSGGSATPVLAVAQALRAADPSVSLLYVGTVDGPEAALAAAQDVPFVAVASGKLRRYWDTRNLSDPLQVLRGVGQAYRLARAFRPHAAFAAGGFAAVPPIVGARLAGARTIIHQQDVEPGLANRLLVPLAHHITLSLASSAEHFPARRTRVTGNPVRREVLAAEPARARAAFDLESDVPLVVVTGGGTGALSLNRLVADAVPRLVATAQVVHLTGRGRGVATVPSPRYHAREFLVDEMPDLLAAATVVVSRAGMGTLTELSALARPSLIVPMPRSHQWANALAFARLGAVDVADQDHLTAATLADRVLALVADPARRARLGRALAESMPTDAAERIAALVRESAAGAR
jgi:UDP-N-acetylglucosamine--N-acetylmuramyl-(pentapeptide) pyrophosphoryl-undecaprenol N-acetylglucosamine transferase